MLNKIASRYLNKIAGPNIPNIPNNALNPVAPKGVELLRFQELNDMSKPELYVREFKDPKLGEEALRQSQEARAQAHNKTYGEGWMMAGEDYLPVDYYGLPYDGRQNAHVKILPVTIAPYVNGSYNSENGEINLYNPMNTAKDLEQLEQINNHEVDHHLTQGSSKNYMQMSNLLYDTDDSYEYNIGFNNSWGALNDSHPSKGLSMLHDLDPWEQQVAFRRYKVFYANKFGKLPPNDYDQMVEDGIAKGIFIKDGQGNISVDPELVESDYSRGMEMLNAGFDYRNNLMERSNPVWVPTSFPKYEPPKLVPGAPYDTEYREKVHKQSIDDFLYHLDNYFYDITSPYPKSEKNFEKAINSKLLEHWNTRQRHNFPQAGVSSKRNYMNPYIKVKG